MPLLSPRIQKESSYFQVVCSVEEGDQPFFFEWSKNGQTIRSGPQGDYQIESSRRSSTLNIGKVARYNAGNYSCLVKNNDGSDSQNVVLNVKGRNIRVFILKVFNCVGLYSVTIYGAIDPIR